ncbi:MAG: AraC family transcriptional regulator [Clostridia bacterium]|nr:AraC family transcriptional regulator [Clostridia bacterium]
MHDKILLAQNKEFTVKIENLSFALIVDINKGETALDPVQLTLHSHVAAELFACNRGRAEIRLEDNTVILQKGDLAIVPPRLAHCLYKSEDAEVSAISFMCRPRSERDTSDLYRELSVFVKGEGVIVYRLQSEISEKIREIVGAAESLAGIPPAIRVIDILLSLAGERSESAQDAKSAVAYDAGYDIQRMARLDQLIHRFYMHDLSAEYVANQLYISTRQLDRIARRRYGKSLHKVVMEKRIKSAAQLLAESDMTVERIASSVGFASAVGFYREFMRYFGTTPAEYRKMKRENQ